MSFENLNDKNKMCSYALDDQRTMKQQIKNKLVWHPIPSPSQVKTVCNSTFPQQYLQVVWLHTLCHYDLTPGFIIILFTTCLAFVWILYCQNTFTLFYNSSNQNMFSSCIICHQVLILLSSWVFCEVIVI
jgi:hypothetical protein